MRSDDSSLLLGNPTQARSGTADPNNILVERPQHALSYNASQGGPNWMSWHVQLSDLGRVGRGDFRPDPLLPAQYQIRPNDYRGSGYDRGHVCPSADRTRSREDNDATFVMSNMLPQAPALNQQVWKKLEDYSRSLVRRGSELYTVAGGLGTKGRIAGGKVNAPAFCWKIILVLPQGDNDLARITPETRVITVLIPNEDTSEVGGARWAKYLTSVRELETKLGNASFFSSLSPSLQKALKAKTDSGRASAEDAIGAIEGRQAPEPAVRIPAQDGMPGMVSGDYYSEEQRRQWNERAERRRAPEQPRDTGVPGTAPSQPYQPYDGGLSQQPIQEPEQAPATSGQVWVNTNSGIYHYPGARWYGNTKQGAYMSEQEALSHGYRAARNGQ